MYEAQIVKSITLHRSSTYKEGLCHIYILSQVAGREQLSDDIDGPFLLVEPWGVELEDVLVLETLAHDTSMTYTTSKPL